MKNTGRPIYSIGTAGARECSMREDGAWFERTRRVGRPGWHAWTSIVGRPAHCWYNPARGRAHLPKD
jgi:hypothetical protein